METMREKKVFTCAMRHNGPFRLAHKGDESFLALDAFIKSRTRVISNKAQTLNLG